jgi:hypothetical protein
MGDVVLTQKQVVAAGLTPAYQSIDATDTYYVNNKGSVFLHFLNVGGSPSVVTFDTEQQVDGLDLENPTVTVPATTGDKMVGPFPASWEVATGAQAGRIKFTQDQASNVTVQATRV